MSGELHDSQIAKDDRWKNVPGKLQMVPLLLLKLNDAKSNTVGNKNITMRVITIWETREILDRSGVHPVNAIENQNTEPEYGTLDLQN